jgi:tRNA pseudouridine-54 N-methylase
MEAALVRCRGVPWETTADELASYLRTALPEGELLELVLGVEAKGTGKARPSGQAYLRFAPPLDSAAVSAALHGRYIGSRYLDVAPCTDNDLSVERERSAAAARRAAVLAPQDFLASSTPVPPPGRRDFVVVFHDAPRALVTGDFELNDIASVRADLLARCCTATLFYSHGVRSEARLWVLFQGWARTLHLDGASARGLRPDERCFAAAIRRALAAVPLPEPAATESARGESGEQAAAAVDGSDAVASSRSGGRQSRRRNRSTRGDEPEASRGWSVHDGDSLQARLEWLHAARAGGPPLVLHEQGSMPVVDALRRSAFAADSSGGAVTLVMGDHMGFTAEEEAVLERGGGLRTALGDLPLLTSQCITIVNWLIDQESSAVKAATLTEEAALREVDASG